MQHKTLCGIASIPGRKHLLKNTLDSLHNQLSHIVVFLNGYKNIPKFEYPNVDYVLTDNAIGAATKFYANKDGFTYYFTADDDLIYPENYIQNLINTLKIYNNKPLVTHHGGMIKKYPLNSGKKILNPRYSFFQNVDTNKFIHWGGTGCMAYHIPSISIDSKNFNHYNMVDLDIYIKSQKENIPIVVATHEAKYIKYQLSARKTRNLYMENRINISKQHIIRDTVNNLGQPKLHTI